MRVGAAPPKAITFFIMNLTGRANGQFKKHLSKLYKDCEWQHDIYNKFSFKYQPISLKYILIKDWFATVGIHIAAYKLPDEVKEHNYSYLFNKAESNLPFWSTDSMEKARTEAVQKANDYYNKTESKK